jgi:arylsulfatase A-like enzyme
MPRLLFALAALVIGSPGASATEPLKRPASSPYGRSRTRPQAGRIRKVPWFTTVVHGGWKYIRYLQPGVPEELYDRAADPQELKNLAAEPKHSALLAQMRDALASELKRSRAPAAMLPPLQKGKK